jgi:hypothetical protein
VSRGRALLALLVTAAVLLGAACGAGPEEDARTWDDESVPFGLLDADVPPLLPPATAADREQVSLCFVEDDRLVAVAATLDPPIGVDDVVDALRQPPADARSLRTAVGPPLVIDQVRLQAGVAEVDLPQAVTELAGDEQLLVVAQLVCTLTSRPGIGTVSFTLAGSPIDVPRGDGSLTSAPVSRDDYAPLLGP